MPTTRWFSREPRALFQRLLDQGWTDAIRTLHSEPMYTFWDYLRNRWPRDAGLRLDHLLLSPEAAKLWWVPVSIETCAAKKARAIMLRLGSS